MKKITSTEDLAGKTIRSVLPSEFDGGVVTIFDDNDWCVFNPIDAGPDASVCMDYTNHGWTGDVSNYLSIQNLLVGNLISKAQHDYLIEQERIKKAAKLRSNAEKMLQDAQVLENQ